MCTLDADRVICLAKMSSEWVNDLCVSQLTG